MLSIVAAASSSSVGEQLTQILGAVLILTAYAAAQFGKLDTQSQLYLVLNLAGSLVLAVLAAVERQYGFLLLEGVWAVVSLWSLIRVLRTGAPAGAHDL